LEKTRQYARGNEAGPFTTTTHSVRLHSDSRDLDCAAGAFWIHGNRDRPNFPRQYEECKSRHDCELPREQRRHRRKTGPRNYWRFDLDQPLYERLVQPGERLYQLIRNSEACTPLPGTGNWFCISGATMDALAIFSGAAGRHLVEFTVSYPVLSLEGTASALKRDWNWAGGGRGGATHLQE